jgi:hypothetical protein
LYTVASNLSKTFSRLSMIQNYCKTALISFVGITCGLMSNVSAAYGVVINSINNLDINGTLYNVQFVANTTYNEAYSNPPTFLGYPTKALNASNAINDYLNMNVATNIEGRISNSGYVIPYNTRTLNNQLVFDSLLSRNFANTVHPWQANPSNGASLNAVRTFATFQEVPEPLTIFGSLTALGIGIVLKRQYDKLKPSKETF